MTCTRNNNKGDVNLYPGAACLKAEGMPGVGSTKGENGVRHWHCIEPVTDSQGIRSPHEEGLRESILGRGEVVVGARKREGLELRRFGGGGASYRTRSSTNYVGTSNPSRGTLGSALLTYEKRRPGKTTLLRESNGFKYIRARRKKGGGIPPSL